MFGLWPFVAVPLAWVGTAFTNRWYQQRRLRRLMARQNPEVEVLNIPLGQFLRNPFRRHGTLDVLVSEREFCRQKLERGWLECPW